MDIIDVSLLVLGTSGSIYFVREILKDYSIGINIKIKGKNNNKEADNFIKNIDTHRKENSLIGSSKIIIKDIKLVDPYEAIGKQEEDINEDEESIRMIPPPFSNHPPLDSKTVDGEEIPLNTQEYDDHAIEEDGGDLEETVNSLYKVTNTAKRISRKVTRRKLGLYENINVMNQEIDVLVNLFHEELLKAKNGLNDNTHLKKALNNIIDKNHFKPDLLEAVQIAESFFI